MQIGDLVDALRKAYTGAPNGEQSTAVHLFGIRYAEQLEGAQINEIAVRAGLTEHLGTEIRKGMRLARHVELKTVH
jgi:uncharacterized protein YunC (DUF1805 family)